jgi:hypothetical protein
MKKLQPRERRMAIVTGVIVVAGLLWSQAIEPTYVSWSEQAEHLSNLEQLASRDREASAKLRALGAERRELDDGLKPPAGQALVPWFIAHLRDVASDASFKASSLRYLRTEPIGKETFAEVRFELRARSSSKELQAFLVRLAASPRHVRVVALGVSPRKSGDSLDIDMTVAALASPDALDERSGGSR